MNECSFIKINGAYLMYTEGTVNFFYQYFIDRLVQRETEEKDKQSPWWTVANSYGKMQPYQRDWKNFIAAGLFAPQNAI